METPILLRRNFLKTATSLTPVLLGTGAALSSSCASQQKKLEQNKAVIIREVKDFWNAKDLSVANQIYSSDLVTHTPNAPDGNYDSYVKESGEAFAAFPDLHLTIEDLIAEGDKVVKRWKLDGTHKKDWMGIPATGEKIFFNGICIFRIKDGKIAESWEYMNLLDVLQQLGVIPPLG
ncbi:MAG: ester cyclase [Candidatus Latescibacteria bacterium]|nr:ester cyclase [Candidatus Latescibacterota bacterium]